LKGDDQMNFVQKQREIRTWQKFAKVVRSNGCHLLKCLGDYAEPVLVTGCQRSGTTLLTRILRHSNGFVDFQVGRDDELDAALILSGREQCVENGRYCFQTTYVNECYHEYFEHRNNVKMIWVLRNPYSVVWSMVYNWERFALNELYHACGEKYHTAPRRNILGKRLLPGVDRLTKACLAYKGKTAQLFELSRQFPSGNLLVIEYDDLILNSQKLLPKIYDFINEPYLDSYSKGIHAKSVNKFTSFPPRKRAIIEEHCATAYSEALRLVLR